MERPRPGEKLGLLPALPQMYCVALGKPLTLSGPDVIVEPFHTEFNYCLGQGGNPSHQDPF